MLLLRNLQWLQEFSARNRGAETKCIFLIINRNITHLVILFLSFSFSFLSLFLLFFFFGGITLLFLLKLSLLSTNILKTLSGAMLLCYITTSSFQAWLLFQSEMHTHLSLLNFILSRPVSWSHLTSTLDVEYASWALCYLKVWWVTIQDNFNN